MAEIIFKEESYKIIGLCMEVHRESGHGFKEAGIPSEREKLYRIQYKKILLKRSYEADFIIYGNIIPEAKASAVIVSGFVGQTINHLKTSGLRLGITADFGQPSFVSKRVVF